MDIAANIGMYLWHADVSNAFAEAELPKKCITCDVTKFSSIGRSERATTHFCLQMPLFRSSKNYRDTLQDHTFGMFDSTAS
jgi:hypothetical protein